MGTVAPSRRAVRPRGESGKIARRSARTTIFTGRVIGTARRPASGRAQFRPRWLAIERVGWGVAAKLLIAEAELPPPLGAAGVALDDP